MELPIAAESYQPLPEALCRAVKRARSIMAAAVAQRTQLDDAVVFTNSDRPKVRLANYAYEVRARADPQPVVAQISAHFEHQGAQCQAWEADQPQWPQRFATYLESLGFVPVTEVVFALQQYRPPSKFNQELQIIPARASYSEVRRLYETVAETELNAAGDLGAVRCLADAMVDRLDEPRFDLFLGRIGGRPVGIAGCVTLGNIGVIEPAYTDPDFRGRGIAATLIDHTLGHCQRAQFQQVIIQLIQGCYAIPFYESLGFAAAKSYVRYSSADGN